MKPYKVYKISGQGNPVLCGTYLASSHYGALQERCDSIKPDRADLVLGRYLVVAQLNKDATDYIVVTSIVMEQTIAFDVIAPPTCYSIVHPDEPRR